MRATSTDAFLLVDKPAGRSSHDVVAEVRRALGTRKVGHGGTLDPFATGLLVVLAGRGTRLLPYVPSEPKVYEALIRFGAATDTDDGTGAVTATGELPAPDAVVAALPGLTGRLLQRPPAYSAKHVDGARAYALARAGRPPELPPVPVEVGAWQVLAQEPGSLTARISCGTGTYIRALARDLGSALGTVAHLERLRRVRVGPFDVADATPLEALRAGEPRVRPLADAIPDLPHVIIDAETQGRVRQGRAIAARAPGARVALLDAAGDVVALARRQGDAWHPDVVLTVA